MHAGFEFLIVHFVLVFYLKMALTRVSALGFADLLKSSGKAFAEMRWKNWDRRCVKLCEIID